MSEKWAQKAFSKNPGKLHRRLHVPEGEKIPAAKLEKAAHSEDPSLRKEAALAKTAKSFHHGGAKSNHGGQAHSIGHHAAHRRSGHLRMSGHSGAHRIGKK